jgi:hypothetical protein
MEYGQTAPNRTVYASLPVGDEKPQSGYAVCTVFIRPKRRKQPECYVQLGTKLVGKYRIKNLSTF